MNPLQRLFNHIQQLQQQGVSFSSFETLQVLESFKEITQQKIIVEKLIANLSIIYDNGQAISELTNRENEIFKLIGLGFSSSEIAHLLAISLQTVATHRKNIIKKLKLSGAGQLQKMAYFRTQQEIN